MVPVIFFLLNLCLQEPPEDDANIIEKILASKTVQEVSGLCVNFSITGSPRCEQRFG